MSQEHEFDDMSSRETPPLWRPDRPFDEMPELPPSVELETRPVLKECVEARAALAALKRSADLIPNPAMLINTLPLLEAQASSEIENVVTTADALFRQLEGSASDPATREALRYREALLEGYRALEHRPITVATAEAIATRIKGVEMRVRRLPGTALENTATGAIIYTPPGPGPKLARMLANWEAFVHGTDPLDPLVRMAAAHYQFEAIHPFTDGNGRTGRVLNSLMLVERGLLSTPILYLSRYIIANRSAYYRGLLGVTRDRAWEPWVLYLVRGVGETARWTTAKIDAILELHRETKRHLREALPRMYSHELVDVLFRQPYCRIANVVEAKIVGRQAAATYLRSLVKIGVLREQAVGREKLFVHVRLLTLLTDDTNEFAPYPRAN